MLQHGLCRSTGWSIRWRRRRSDRVQSRRPDAIPVLLLFCWFLHDETKGGSGLRVFIGHKKKHKNKSPAAMEIELRAAETAVTVVVK